MILSHFLVIAHEFYDTSTVLGVHDRLVDAQDSVEALLELQDEPASDRDRERRFAARHATIEEWRGSEHLANYERTSSGWLAYRAR